MRIVIAFCALVVGLVAGCANRQGGQSPARPVEAADGTNLEACVDGNCEVELSGPATIPLGGQAGGLTALDVDGLSDSGIEFTTATSEGSSSSGELARGCTLTFYEGGGGSMCSSGEAPRPERQTGVLAMQLTAVTDGKVVLLLVAGEPGEPPTSLVPRIPSIEVPVPTVHVPAVPGS